MTDKMYAEPLVRVRGLLNRFGANVVHEGLDLDLFPGEILGVVGGSGTGKSVLLHSILGLNRPAAGEIRFFGENLFGLPGSRGAELKRRCGVLFQKGALFSSLTTIENIALPLIEHAGLSRADAESLAWVKLALTGLPSNAGLLYPAELSGGMVKRAALARALAARLAARFPSRIWSRLASRIIENCCCSENMLIPLRKPAFVS